MESTNNSLNVIYLCTAEKGPSGGAKTIYNHSNLINKLNITNVTSEILHVKKRKISKWNSSIKKIFKIRTSNILNNLTIIIDYPFITYIFIIKWWK